MISMGLRRIERPGELLRLRARSTAHARPSRASRRQTIDVGLTD